MGYTPRAHIHGVLPAYDRLTSIGRFAFNYDKIKRPA